MREINFRAWYAEKEKMYVVAKVDMWGDPDQAICDLCSTDEELFDIYLSEVEIMQYTGLKDKNGVEIYEGDIIRIDGMGVGVVDYEEGRFAMHRKEERFCWPVYCRIDHSPFVPEIIGNIHDNPELLEVK